MNCAVYKLKSPNEIHAFILDCVMKDIPGRNMRRLAGSNMKINISSQVFGWKWTNDTAIGNMEQGYNKSISDLAETVGTEIATSSDSDRVEAYSRMEQLANMTYADVEDYVNANVTDLASAKNYLKLLSKVVLGIIKITR